MLILTGPDNVGKTTLAHRLTELAYEINPFKGTKFPYRHLSRPSEDFNFFTDYISLIDINTIWDRFHIEAIAYHDPVPYDQNKLKYIESWLYKLGSMIIICLPDSNFNYKLRLEKSNRKEMFDVDRNIKAFQIYEDIIYDPEELIVKPTYDEVIEVVIDYNGKIVSTANDEHLKTILKTWFDRIRLVDEIKKYELKHGIII